MKKKPCPLNSNILARAKEKLYKRKLATMSECYIVTVHKSRKPKQKNPRIRFYMKFSRKLRKCYEKKKIIWQIN